MVKNVVKFFHTLIIAGILFSFSGCGYKADPVYKPNTQQQTTQQ